MNINAGVVDQQVTGIVNSYRNRFLHGKDEVWCKSAAFVVLCMKSLPYAGDYVAMRVGGLLLSANGIKLEDLTHRTYEAIAKDFQENVASYYCQAVGDIANFVAKLYGGRSDLSLQQLSATFRSGDLLEVLNR